MFSENNADDISSIRSDTVTQCKQNTQDRHHQNIFTQFRLLLDEVRLHC